MKFTSTILDKTVSTDKGIITFRDGSYETTNKDEIKSLEKAKNVVKVGGRTVPTAAIEE